jgi:uncharacterized protein
MSSDWVLPVLLSLASFAAGAVNALAGGGTLLTFPAIMATGISALTADATNALIVCPGFLGALYAQRKGLRAYRHVLWKYLAVSFMGGLSGGALLLWWGEKVFLAIVPFLLMTACLLLAFQEKIRSRLFADQLAGQRKLPNIVWSLAAVSVAAIYGGYFGAGMSVILLAILGLTQEGSLQEINTLKQPISLTVNVAASLLFLLAGRISWPVAGLMSAGAIAGGYLGGRVAGMVRPAALRWTIVILGGMITIVYFLRLIT